MRFRTCILLSSLALSACDTRSEPPPPAQPPAWVVEAQQRSAQVDEAAVVGRTIATEPYADRAMLWEVKGPGGATSHLLGIVESTDFAGLDALPATVRSAFEASKVVVLEFDTGASAAEAVAPFARLPDGQSLQAEFTAEQWASMVELTGLADARLERVRPWVVQGLLRQKWAPRSASRGMTSRFNILARAHDKRHLYLETPARQAEQMSQLVTASALAAQVDDPDGTRARMKAIDDAFRAGDTEALTPLVLADPHVVGITRARDARWITAVLPALGEGGAFLAVDIEHLLGEQNLMDRLSEQGFVVTRL